MKNFADLGLSDNILRAVQDKGYETPSPVQAKAIPAVLTRKDLLAAAQTGTGKTAAFALPLLHLLAVSAQQTKKRSTRALILAPTRELAVHANLLDVN